MTEEILAHTFHLAGKTSEGGGATVTYLKGTPKSALPDDVVVQLAGNPIAFTTQIDAAGSPTLSAVEDPEADTGPKEPPREGRGSGVNAWRAFAESLDVEVDDTLTRDEIVELLQKDGHIA